MTVPKLLKLYKRRVGRNDHVWVFALHILLANYNHARTQTQDHDVTEKIIRGRVKAYRGLFQAAILPNHRNSTPRHIKTPTASIKDTVSANRHRQAQY